MGRDAPLAATQIALNMKAAVFVPDEVVPPGSLYVLHRGLVLYGGRVLGAGKSWGTPPRR